MDIFADILSSASYGTATSMVIALLLGAFYVVYVIPLIKEYEALKAEKETWAEQMDDLRKRLDQSSETIKNHVDKDTTEEQLGELIRTCQMMNNVLVDYVRKADSEARDLSKDLESLRLAMIELRSLCSSDKAVEKLVALDSDMAFLSQQISLITNKLSGISGILVGAAPGNGRSVVSDLMGMGEVKDLK